MSYEIVSLKKGLSIVDLLKEGLPLSLTEIQRQLNMSKTTTFRLLYTLQEVEYVLRVGNFYMLHPKQLSSLNQPRSFSWTYLRSIADFGSEIDRSIYIGTLHNTTLHAEKVYDADEKKFVSNIFALPSPAHQTALGKAIVANLDEKEQVSFFSQISLEKATEETFTDPYLFLQHLRIIKEQHYAMDLEESYFDIHCIAVPIYFQNKVIASIGISDNKEKLTKNQMRQIVRQTKQVSQKITEELSVHEHVVQYYRR